MSPAGFEFRIADTFTDSLASLATEEQKAVKTSAFDLQINAARPGLQFHKLDKAKDPRFWSVRVNKDIRLIVHRTERSLLLCYVDHHDEAYKWAERRRLETHPKTGAAQLVEIREITQDVIVPRYVEAVAVAPAKAHVVFAGIADDELLGYGVPPNWLLQVREANEDTILDIAAHLPAEAAEALLVLATGAKPKSPQPVAPGADPFAHPDAQRRFRVVNDLDELARALDYPWDKWTVFLHPAQRQLIERDYTGPARVSGSAGTGKTIVALHRAAYLARNNPDARVLLTTISDPLAQALHTKLRRLVSNEPRLAERLEVQTLDGVARRLYVAAFGAPKLATSDDLQKLLPPSVASFNAKFLLSEWEHVVDPWQLDTWDAYRDVPRLGRKTRLTEAKRKLLWEAFAQLRSDLNDRHLITRAAVYTRVARRYAEGQSSPFDFAVVDEAQDIGVPEIRFLAALGGNRPNGLFFAGDLGQRIFQQPFSWKMLGIDVRGRSSTLKINYRTSHQIRMQADRLLGPEISDVDGNKEDRRGTVSVFNGPPPKVQTFDTEGAEIQEVSTYLADAIKAGTKPHEIGIFVRSTAQIERATSAVAQANLRNQILDNEADHQSNRIAIGTMHLAKGLEYKSVVVMACDDEVIPLQSRIESVTDDSDLEEVYNTERHLFYVALTRARDQLLITATNPHSEFLDDFKL